MDTSDIVPVSSKDFLDIQEWNNVADMQVQRKRFVTNCLRENNRKLCHYDTLKYDLKQTFIESSILHSYSYSSITFIYLVV